MTPGAALSLEHLRLALEALDDGVIVLSGDLQVLFVNAALRTALGHEPTASTADLLERAGYQVVRSDGTPWPLEDRPVQRAAQEGLTSRAC